MLVEDVSRKAVPVRSAEVDALIEERAHPLADTITAIRAALLDVPSVIESVKWNAPNYALADDFATMSLRRDAAVQLILHTGAKIKPDHPDIVLVPFPASARRAARNRVVLTYGTASLTEDERSELDATLRSWTTQLA